MLSGDNGILKKAGDAKELTGIGQEKEIVALAYNSALAKKVGNGDSTVVTAGDLNPELTNQGASATDGSNSITVTFDVSKRQYTIDTNGKIEYAGITNSSPSTNTFEIPEDLVVGSIIHWTPSGGIYHWNGIYASSFQDDGSNDFFEDENTDDFHIIDSNLASGSAYENLNTSVKSNYKDMTISSWKVLSVDRANNKIEIVPTKSTYSYNEQTDEINGNVYLHGAQGYNNGVKLLNDACKILYGDESHGITARSINIEDIEKIANSTALETAKIGSGFGSYTYNYFSSHASDRNETTGAFIRYKSYPQLFTQEKSCYINYVDEASTECGNLKLSESPTQDGNTVFISGTNQTSNTSIGALDATTNIRPMNTYYEAIISDLLPNNYLSIINSEDWFWVASRFVQVGTDIAFFSLRGVAEPGQLNNGYSLFNSRGECYAVDMGLYPVVSLTSGIIEKNGEEFAFTIKSADN